MKKELVRQKILEFVEKEKLTTVKSVLDKLPDIYRVCKEDPNLELNVNYQQFQQEALSGLQNAELNAMMSSFFNRR